MALGAWLFLFGGGGAQGVVPPICVAGEPAPMVFVKFAGVLLAASVEGSSEPALSAAGFARQVADVDGEPEAC